jgi:Spy/CpxP family protein refolding chaperone
MKRMQLVVLLTALSMLLVPAAMAQGMGSMGKFRELDLTVEQQQKIEKLRTNLLAKIGPTVAQLAAKRSELHTLWLAPEPDKKAILAKEAEMDALRVKIREAHADFRLEALKVLTPEQRARFFLMPSERGPGMGMGRGMMGMGRGRAMDMEDEDNPGCGCMHE